MPLFWPLAALLTIASLAALLWPLLRRDPQTDAPDAGRAAIAVYRDHKRALDAERESGAISADERDAALSELTRRVAEETETGAAMTSPRGTPSKRAWAVAAALAVIVPSAVLLLYQRLGNPGASVVADVAASHEVSEQQILAMVDSLAQRLKQKPDDADGWILLARSYRALERFPESADAYAHANALVKDDASLLADYADVLAMAQGRKLAGKPAELIERALKIDPRQQKALALAATLALEQSDFARSLDYWRRLAAQLAPGSDEARQVAAVITEIESAHPDAKGAPAARARIAAGPAAGSSEAPAASKNAAIASAAGAAGSISGRVDIAPALTSKVSIGDTVFIYARPAEGSRMPLAVLRIPAKELPRAFVLDDSMAMAPGAVLSKATSVVVEARISKSGNAIPQPGDLFGRSAPMKPGASGLAIVIDSVVP